VARWWVAVCGGCRAAVDCGSLVVGGAVGSGPGGDPVGGHGEVPASFVDEVVVAFAQWQEVVDVGGAVVSCPPADVVDFGVAERDIAVGVGAGAVHGA